MPRGERAELEHPQAEAVLPAVVDALEQAELVQRGDEAAHRALVQANAAREVHDAELGGGFGESEQQAVGFLQRGVATDGGLELHVFGFGACGVGFAVVCYD